MRPIAIVIPWFGTDLKGGAEQQALQIALRLAARGHAIEVLTTCCRDFQEDWSTNHFTEGVSTEQGLTIRRFAVDKRDPMAFDRVNAELLSLSPADLKRGVSPLSGPEVDTFVEENINSSDLLD